MIYMDQVKFVLYTLAIILTCNFLGFLISIVTIHFPFLHSFRIQKRKIKSSIFYARLPLIILNIILLMLISTFGLYFLYFLFDPILKLNFLTIIFQLLFILLIDDVYFYFLHFWMHTNKYVLKKIHRIHHKAITPVALEYIYVHPIEWLLGYIGPFVAIFIISLVQPVSILAFWAYQIIRNIHELDVHSGFKSLFSKWIPFWGESEHHDLHHEKLNGNYATTFTIWDRIFKTKIQKNEK